MKTVSKCNLRPIRESVRVETHELAEMCGISENYLNSIEDGQLNGVSSVLLIFIVSMLNLVCASRGQPRFHTHLSVYGFPVCLPEGSDIQESNKEYIIDSTKWRLRGHVEAAFNFEATTRSVEFSNPSAGYADTKGVALEFTEEYLQAGINLLSYFSTYLRKNYPNNKATIKIEQEGLKVHLLIEPEAGKPEALTELLTDYISGISGKLPLETITTNTEALIDLRSQVRFAAAQVETQKDILAIKDAEIGRLHSVLLKAVESKNIINVNPSLVNTNQIKMDRNHSDLLRELDQIRDYLRNQDDSNSIEVANDLDHALESGDETNTKSILKSSGQFVLDVATKIGAPVATAYIKELLGIK